MHNKLQQSASFANQFIRIHGQLKSSIQQDFISDEVVVHDGDESFHAKTRSCFQVTAPFEPTGDQPQAIEQLAKQLQQGDQFSILRGVTGTGKTLVMSHVIARNGKPTLVLCHNKTLAAQLARELRSFLGKNAVELFVSYYNHYVPESYNEVTGTYVAKKSSINQDIDAMRHRATRALLIRHDVVVVASVSCIYGLGLPKDYLEASTTLAAGDVVESPKAFLGQLKSMLYTHEPLDDAFGRGHYQYRQSINNAAAGTDTSLFDITLWPPHESFPIRILLEQGNDEWSVKSIQQGHAHGHSEISSPSYCLFPAKHHVMSEERLEEACLTIEEECTQQVKDLTAQGKIVEANRLQQRVANDLLMLRETGFCSGAENYTRHFSQRKAGEPPDTLIDYLALQGREWLLLVDESHVTVPQLRAMYAGDRARKQRLVKHGYRLPSALDNRPLQENEFWEKIQQTIFVSATPSKQEYALSNRNAVEMVIRPTFVCDPSVEVRPLSGQLENLLKEIQSRAKQGERALVVALTKRDAEDLSHYLNENDVSSAFIHSGLNTHERAEALKSLQSGEVDCLVGVNLLREGLDLPQVSLVAIMNADSEVR
jgi:excinuclease ABC subunit B